MPARLRPTILTAVLLLVAAPVTAVAQDVDDARDRAAALESQLEQATTRYEEAVAAIEEAEAELAQLLHRADELEVEAERIEQRLGDRARRAFMHGSASSIEVVLAAGGPEAAAERAGLVTVVQERDTAGLEEAVAVRSALEQTHRLVGERRAALEDLEEELDRQRQELQDRLASAEARVEALERVAARQRSIDRDGQSGVYACPMHPGVSHFIDSWGSPRSGGRRHKGTDVMGPMGAEVYAFTDGVIARQTNSRLGGISLYLRGDDGSTYFYTHLQGYADKGATGTRVRAGDHIAYNGNTGNARGGAPHVHFERHPGGGAAVNPYPYLAAACV